MIVPTIYGPADESLLVKRVDTLDNDNELTVATEYCLVGCTGTAHVINKADSDSHFCAQHVHRSAHVQLKKVDNLISSVGSFA